MKQHVKYWKEFRPNVVSDDGYHFSPTMDNFNECFEWAQANVPQGFVWILESVK